MTFLAAFLKYLFVFFVFFFPRVLKQILVFLVFLKFKKKMGLTLEHHQRKTAFWGLFFICSSLFKQIQAAVGELGAVSFSNGLFNGLFNILGLLKVIFYFWPY